MKSTTIRITFLLLAAALLATSCTRSDDPAAPAAGRTPILLGATTNLSAQSRGAKATGPDYVTSGPVESGRIRAAIIGYESQEALTDSSQPTWGVTSDGTPNTFIYFDVATDSRRVTWGSEAAEDGSTQKYYNGDLTTYAYAWYPADKFRLQDSNKHPTNDIPITDNGRAQKDILVAKIQGTQNSGPQTLEFEHLTMFLRFHVKTDYPVYNDVTITSLTLGHNTSIYSQDYNNEPNKGCGVFKPDRIVLNIGNGNKPEVSPPATPEITLVYNEAGAIDEATIRADAESVVQSPKLLYQALVLPETADNPRVKNQNTLVIKEIKIKENGVEIKKENIRITLDQSAPEVYQREFTIGYAYDIYLTLRRTGITATAQVTSWGAPVEIPEIDMQ